MGEDSGMFGKAPDEGPLVQQWFEQLKKSKAKRGTNYIEVNMPPGN